MGQRLTQRPLGPRAGLQGWRIRAQQKPVPAAQTRIPAEIAPAMARSPRGREIAFQSLQMGQKVPTQGTAGHSGRGKGVGG